MPSRGSRLRRACPPCSTWRSARWRSARRTRSAGTSRSKKDAQDSVDALLLARSFDASGPGWGWGDRDPAPNTLATAFAVLGLKAAKTAELFVPQEGFDAALAVFARASAEDGLVGCRRPGDAASVTLGDPARAPAVPLFTAGATIGRLFCGVKRGEASVARGVAQLAARPPSADEPEPLYWYLGTYALFQGTGLDSEEWKRQSAHLQAALRSTAEKGSYAPAGIIGDLCGRVGSTALAVLAHEIYYRYERAVNPPPVPEPK